MNTLNLITWIRLLALLSFVLNISYILPSFLNTYDNPEFYTFSYYALLSLSVIIIPLILWIFAPFISGLINVIEDSSHTNISAKNFLQIGIILIGLFYLPQSVFELAGNISYLIAPGLELEKEEMLKFSSAVRHGIIQGSIKTIFSLILIIGSKRLTEVLFGDQNH